MEMVKGDRHGEVEEIIRKKKQEMEISIPKLFSIVWKLVGPVARLLKFKFRYFHISLF